MTYVDSAGVTCVKETIRTGHFTITRDGFTLLAMGFTGKKALAFKLAYIDAFNAMAAYIKNQREGLQFQFLREELEYKTVKAKVSRAARQMRDWQGDKPARLNSMDSLLKRMQGELALGDATAATH